MDFSALSNQDLLALKSKDYSKLSNEGLVQLRDHVNQNQPQESGLDKAVRYSKAVTDTIAKPFQMLRDNMPPSNRMETLGSPQQLLESVPALASQAAGKLGQFGAEQAAKAGMNPYLAAAQGTITSMAPDIAMSVAPEGEPVKAVESAVPMGEHALGFSKQLRKTPFARETATEATRSALENNVISVSPDKMMANAQALEQKGAQAMNDVFSNASQWKEAPVKFRSSSPPDIQEAQLVGGPVPAASKDISLNTPSTQSATVPRSPASTVFEQSAEIVDPKKMIRALEELRPSQPRMGKYAAKHAVIDEAIDTVKANGNSPMTLEEANGIKSTLAEDIKYGAPGQKLPKRIAATIREVVDSSLDEVANKIGDPSIKQKFMAAKRIYGTARRMQEGINNRLSIQGNNIVNPYSMMSGLGAAVGTMAAHGKPLESAIVGAATAGLGVLAKKAGPAIAAQAINQVGNAGRFAGPIATTSAALDRLAQVRKRNK